MRWLYNRIAIVISFRRDCFSACANDSYGIFNISRSKTCSIYGIAFYSFRRAPTCKFVSESCVCFFCRVSVRKNDCIAVVIVFLF